MLLSLGVGYYLLYGSPTQRKRALVALGVIALLLMLGGISYYLCLPDLEGMARDHRAILQDPNLTWGEKREKIREMDSRLTPAQARQVFQIEHKQRARELNAEMHRFLQMSPEEQAAYLKKRDRERNQFRQQGGSLRGEGPRGGGAGDVPHVVRGPGGGGPGGGGLPVMVGFRSGGGGPESVDPGRLQKNLIDNLSPETRAAMSYQRGLPR
jgi:hypothetical protein